MYAKKTDRLIRDYLKYGNKTYFILNLSNHTAVAI